MYIISEVNFNIRYFNDIWQFDIDRGKFHPIVLENIIEQSITPLKSSNRNINNNYEMAKTYKVKEFDLNNKPPTVLGREGFSANLLVNYPKSLNNRKENDELYELILVNDKLEWKRI